MISYSICLSLSDISLSIISSKSIHVATNGQFSFYFYDPGHDFECGTAPWARGGQRAKAERPKPASPRGPPGCRRAARCFILSDPTRQTTPTLQMRRPRPREVKRHRLGREQGARPPQAWGGPALEELAGVQGCCSHGPRGGPS